MRGVARVGLALIALITSAHGKPRIWQTGQVTSHKTLPVPGHSPNHEHLYGVTSGGQRYMIILDRPLQVKVNEQVKFSRGRKHLRILDSDGQERKGTLLEKVSVAGGGH
jgi:hypothetical protein